MIIFRGPYNTCDYDSNVAISRYAICALHHAYIYINQLAVHNNNTHAFAAWLSITSVLASYVEGF